jgi:XTP/dITP diphosphohydrolase
VGAVSGDGSAASCRLVLATANPDKAREIVQIVSSASGGRIELIARPESLGEVDETGESLEDNARIKAMAVLEATGMASIADDTGLEVDALDGAPGVRSSRYSGEGASYDENVAKLLSELERVGALAGEERSARFRTVAIAAFPDGHEVVAHGTVEGRICSERRGSKGFGYDPVFVPEGRAETFAEMEPTEKHSLSHRGRAFRALAIGLLSELGG